MTRGKILIRTGIAYLFAFLGMYIFSIYSKIGFLSGRVVSADGVGPSIFLATIYTLLTFLFIVGVIISIFLFYRKKVKNQMKKKTYSPFKSIVRKS